VTITFRQLEIFAAIVRYGSFRRCADHLAISPEAVSANIRGLESQLGYPLFERHAGGPATLTGPGERAVQFASAILDDLGALCEVGDRGAPRRIVVGAHPYIMRYLQAGIDAFRATHPHIVVELDIDSSSALGFPDKAARRMVDLGYYFAFDDNGEAAPVPSVLMKEEPLAIFVARDHPLAAKARVGIADIADLPMIRLSERTALRPLIDRALGAYGVVAARTGVETDDYGHILTSTRRGEGYACMFASAHDEADDASALKRLAMQTPLPSLQIRRTSRSLRRGALSTELERDLRATFTQ
jgi:DNA-binding transcriptional LysR family regulator